MGASATASVPVRATRIAYVAAHLAFVINGVVTTFLGPMLPVLAVRWQLDDARLGRLFIAQFIGSTFGVLISGWIAARAGFTRTLVGGYLLMSIGLMLFARAGWPQGFLYVFLYGTALGLTIPVTNVFVAAVSNQDREAALNVLNAAWTLGAIAAPWLVSWSRNSGGAQLLWTLAAALLGSSILLTQAPISAAVKENSIRPRGNAGRDLRHLWFFATLFFLYVGTETAVSGWIALHGLRISQDAMFGWALASSFWAALLLGRLLAPFLLRRLNGDLILRAGLTLSTAGIAFIAGADRGTAIEAAVIVSGFGLAAVFPLLIAMMTRHYGNATHAAASVCFAFAGVGGATMPWLVGTSSHWARSLQAGLVIPAIGAAAILLLVVAKPAGASGHSGIS